MSLMGSEGPLTCIWASIQNSKEMTAPILWIKYPCSYGQSTHDSYIKLLEFFSIFTPIYLSLFLLCCFFSRQKEWQFQMMEILNEHDALTWCMMHDAVLFFVRRQALYFQGDKENKRVWAFFSSGHRTVLLRLSMPMPMPKLMLLLAAQLNTYRSAVDRGRVANKFFWTRCSPLDFFSFYAASNSTFQIMCSNQPKQQK